MWPFIFVAVSSVTVCGSVDHLLVCHSSPFGECDGLRILSPRAAPDVIRQCMVPWKAAMFNLAPKPCQLELQGAGANWRLLGSNHNGRRLTRTSECGERRVCMSSRTSGATMLTVHLNNRSSILQGASLPIISGGEFNNSEGDHNRITITIRKVLSSELCFSFKNSYLDQGVQRHRDDRQEPVSSSCKGQPLFS
jgi:hypothetical protein